MNEPDLSTGELLDLLVHNTGVSRALIVRALSYYSFFPAAIDKRIADDETAFDEWQARHDADPDDRGSGQVTERPSPASDGPIRKGEA